MKVTEKINTEFKELLYNEKNVIAAWEGGSAATGFYDEYSDLDLAIVCEDDAVEDIFKLIESHIEKNYGIINKFRIPEPAWHGFSQCFYKIDNVPKLYYLDIAVIKRSVEDKFTAKDRHGNAVVWFEKEKMIDPTPTTEEEVKAKGKKFYKMVTGADWLSITELKKQLSRGYYAESISQYNQLVMRNLGVMLNLKYRPCKVDFGTRYYYRDLPKEVFAKFERLLKNGSINELKENSVKLLEWYGSLKKELAKEWS
ncbi:MAG: nucleotidyltransferase domain-containing protein [Candidatus Delongbacteria bacterium]|jgi:predicted nucleotidyltransferase|nr:nucleotidyltransferase domain-containing protein [Candidatus Delongbacteria bacterium]